MKEPDKMTIKELVDELTSLGVSFNKKSRKAELLDLYLDATKENVGDAAGQKEAEKASVSRQPSGGPDYAIIRAGGKQYQVSAGSLLQVDKMTGDIGDTVELPEVLAVVDGDNAMIGQPTVEGALVTARIVEQGKAKKVLVFKRKRRKGYRVKRGHRQMFTTLKISGITV